MQLFINFILLIFLTSCVGSYSDQHYMNKKKLSNLTLKIGYEYLLSKDLPQAKKYFLSAYHLAPKSSRTNMALAYYFSLVEHNKYADFFFRKSIYYAKNKGAYWNNYGIYLCDHGKFLEGEKYLLWAAKDVNYTNNAIAYENASFCALKQKKYYKSNIFYKKSLLSRAVI